MTEPIMQLIRKSLESLARYVRAIKDAVVSSNNNTLIKELEANTEAIKELDPISKSEATDALVALGIPETQDDLLRGIWFTNKAILAELRTLRTHLEIINDEEVEVCDAD